MKLVTGIAALVILGLGAMGYLLYHDVTDVEQGQRIPAVPWLPAAASDISYIKSYTFTAYEFDITQPEFVRWSDQNGWHANPVTGRASLLDWQKQNVTIEAGLFYAHEFGNGGGVWVAYDSKARRAYFQSMPR